MYAHVHAVGESHHGRYSRLPVKWIVNPSLRSCRYQNPSREAPEATDRAGPARPVPASSDEYRAYHSKPPRLTVHPLPTPSRPTGHQGQGWPGWCWLQGLHRGGLRPQDVRAYPFSTRREPPSHAKRNTKRARLFPIPTRTGRRVWRVTRTIGVPIHEAIDDDVV